METENKQENIRYTVVMPVELMLKIDEEATLQKRSKLQQTVWIIEKYFENKELKKEPQAAF